MPTTADQGVLAYHKLVDAMVAREAPAAARESA
jgi:hypothetical protein